MMGLRSLRASVLWAGLLLTAAGCDRAPSEETKEARRAGRIAEHTRSPFCPGRSLSGCPSEQAGEWRADIRQWVREGRTDAEIVGNLQSRAPPGFELRPDHSDVGVYWFIASVGAGAVLVLLAWRWNTKSRGEGPAGGSETSPGSGDDGSNNGWDARLDEELRRIDDPDAPRDRG